MTYAEKLWQEYADPKKHIMGKIDFDAAIKEAMEAQQEACLKAAQETFYERGNCWDEEVDDAILNAEVQL